VLQEQEFQRVGGNKEIKVNVRLVAATNKDLKEEVELGRFRGDLFFRLNVVNIKVPPLRERRSDIPFLVAHFVSKYSQKLGRNIREVSPDAMKSLFSYNWPGNVRELENVIESALVMSNGSSIKKNDLPREIKKHNETPEGSSTLISMDSGLMDTLDAIEEKMIRQALKQSGNVQAQAAKILGISRSNLQYKLKKYGIQAE
jgi:DNA-binding NtrC family response regulator